ncbi:TetR/AcrR family transcriptional regulator [Streptomyces sp. Root431]|uniref:TetR/AcrR family transcriptional regulator n=1 Tax=Streptomyces sp. Root431 TaxID=1736535 RepID=UPI000A4AC535|nr:TetR/AcrR family transcriptional regulator [Streptomyces sp. Root431]
MSKDAATPLRRPMRADARRNLDKIVAAAGAVIAERGAEASLEEVARRAGVGSATLHRHFPSRQALLEAVFKDRVETLCAKADDLLADPEADPGQALATWLHAVAAHAVANRGLGSSLMRDADPALGETCHDMITTAGDALLARARAAGAVRPGVTVTRLLKLVGAIALATERDADGPAEAELLLRLAIDGVRTR